MDPSTNPPGGKTGSDSPAALKKKIEELEGKLSSTATLQKENADLKKQVDQFKSKKPSISGK